MKRLLRHIYQSIALKGKVPTLKIGRLDTACGITTSIEHDKRTPACHYFFFGHAYINFTVQYGIFSSIRTSMGRNIAFSLRYRRQSCATT